MELTKDKWFEIGTPEASAILLKEQIKGIILVAFDNGEYRRYDEEYPFAEATHVMYVPKVK